MLPIYKVILKLEIVQSKIIFQPEYSTHFCAGPQNNLILDNQNWKSSQLGKKVLNSREGVYVSFLKDSPKIGKVFLLKFSLMKVMIWKLVEVLIELKHQLWSSFNESKSNSNFDIIVGKVNNSLITQYSLCCTFMLFGIDSHIRVM